MKKYIKVRKDEIYTAENVAILNAYTEQWETARPELYDCNLFEAIQHKLGYHFSFGQPYCVVCGFADANLTNH